METNALTFFVDVEGDPRRGPLRLSNDAFHIEVPLDDGSDLRLRYYLEPSTNTSYLHKESYNLGVEITSDHKSVIFRTILKTDISSKCYSTPMKEVCRADVIIDKDAYRNQVIMDSIFTYNICFPKPATHNAVRRAKVKMVFEIDVFMSSFSNEPLSFYGAGSNPLSPLNRSYQRRGVLVQNLTKLYYSRKDFSDLKLKSRDNMTINAHKMILAARSPNYLKNLLESKVSQPDFNGTLEIDSVDAKPLISVLHWMYTEDLPQGCGRFIGDIVEAAVLFKLEDLLDLLNKTMIRYCHPQNMFELFRVAEKQSMRIAMVQISEYIKTNVDSLAGLKYMKAKQTDHVKPEEVQLFEIICDKVWRFCEKTVLEDRVFRVFGTAFASVLMLTLSMMYYFNFMM